MAKSGNSPIKVLIDRNIEINARTHKSVLAPKSVQWGDITVQCEVLQRAACPPRPDEKFRTEQLPYLASVCQLAKDSTLTLYTTHEMMMERFRQKGRSEGYVGLNLLRDIKLEHTKTPVDRTLVIDPFRGSIGVTEAEQMQFFNSITDTRFLEIRNGLGGAQIDDAFHLWTAETNALDVFLTMDQKFWNNVNKNSHKINSTIAVLTPKELCERFGALPTNIENLANESHPFS